MKKVSIDTHYEAKIFFTRHLKIAWLDIFWGETSISGLKIKIGKHLIHFLAKHSQNLENSRESRKIPRFWQFFFGQEWNKYFLIWIFIPGLESSLQNTSDHTIFICLEKGLIFGSIMGVNWDYFCSEQDGGRVKWKMTDAILFPHVMSTIKSWAHHALQLATHPSR